MRAPLLASYTVIVTSLVFPFERILAADVVDNSRRADPVTSEIVVTATKEGEINLQRAPLAITAFTSDQLENTGADNVEDLKWQTPGFNTSRNGQAARLYLRGIGTNLDFIGADPSVTVHVDGVYQSRPTNALEDFLDVARVEILRGPQGTLYGRNSVGGTINIISRLPNEEARAKASIELGSFNFTRKVVSASGALASDRLFGGVALMKTDHDPYVENTNDDGVDGLSDDDSFSSRATLRLLLGGSTEAIFRMDYTKIDRATGAYKATGRDTEGSPTLFAESIDQPEDPFAINISYAAPFVEQTDAGASLELKIELSNNLTLTSLTGFRDLDYHTVEDTDGSALDVFVTEIDDKQSQLSEELRFNYQTNRLNLVSGFYYLLDNHESESVVNVNLSGAASVFDVENETTAYALFGNGRYAVNDQLNISVGLRYSEEEKVFDDVRQGVAPGGAVATIFTIDDTETWNSWSPKLAVDYQTDDGALLFGSVSRGFKSGGYNFTLEDGRFEPEYVTAYEWGVKKDWRHSGLRSNMAFFFYDYTDMQVSDFSEVGAPKISNAAEAVIFGFELENRWVPTLDWLFEFNFSYLHAQYEKYMAPAPSGEKVDVSGNQLNVAPERKLNLAAQYYQDIAWGTLSYRLEYAWQTRQYFTAFNEDISSQATYGLVNARVAFNGFNDQWELHLYGENLGDKDYSTSSREFTATTVGVTRDINPPRTYGVKIIHRFL